MVGARRRCAQKMATTSGAIGYLTRKMLSTSVSLFWPVVETARGGPVPAVVARAGPVARPVRLGACLRGLRWLSSHGFLSQGYFLTSNNNILRRQRWAAEVSDFTEIGVNVSWVPRPDVQLAIQGLSRRAGGAAEGEPELDFGSAGLCGGSDRRPAAGGPAGAGQASLWLLQRHARCGLHSPQHPAAAIHLLRRGPANWPFRATVRSCFTAKSAAPGKFHARVLGPFSPRVNN